MDRLQPVFIGTRFEICLSVYRKRALKWAHRQHGSGEQETVFGCAGEGLTGAWTDPKLELLLGFSQTRSSRWTERRGISGMCADAVTALS